MTSRSPARLVRRSNCVDYYDAIKLNPVGHNISDRERFLAHERKRRNLLEHHLKLPLRLLDGKRVLEFGPASGENAVVLARHGARMTLVEPLDYLAAELKAKFAAFGVSDRIEALHLEVLERFSTDRRFDVVIAEGFIQFLDDAAAGTRKLASFLAPGGLLLISTTDTTGMFVEFLTKVYFELAAAKLGLVGADSRLELLRELLEEKFNGINHSRGFEAYAKDMPLNPLVRPRFFFSLPDAFSKLPLDVVLHTSWPNYLGTDLVWHKNIKSASQIRDEALRGYFSLLPHFIDGTPLNSEDLPLLDSADGLKLYAALKAAYAKLERCYLRREVKPQPYLAALSEVRRRLRGRPQARRALSVVDEFIALFEDARRATDGRAFARALKKRRLLNRLWGVPGHYLVFQKTDLFKAAA